MCKCELCGRLCKFVYKIVKTGLIICELCALPYLMALHGEPHPLDKEPMSPPPIYAQTAVSTASTATIGFDLPPPHR